MEEDLRFDVDDVGQNLNKKISATKRKSAHKKRLELDEFRKDFNANDVLASEKILAKFYRIEEFAKLSKKGGFFNGQQITREDAVRAYNKLKQELSFEKDELPGVFLRKLKFEKYSNLVSRGFKESFFVEDESSGANYEPTEVSDSLIIEFFRDFSKVNNVAVKYSEKIKQGLDILNTLRKAKLDLESSKDAPLKADKGTSLSGYPGAVDNIKTIYLQIKSTPDFDTNVSSLLLSNLANIEDIEIFLYPEFISQLNYKQFYANCPYIVSNCEVTLKSGVNVSVGGGADGDQYTVGMTFFVNNASWKHIVCKRIAAGTTTSYDIFIESSALDPVKNAENDTQIDALVALEVRLVSQEKEVYFHNPKTEIIQRKQFDVIESFKSKIKKTEKKDAFKLIRLKTGRVDTTWGIWTLKKEATKEVKWQRKRKIQIDTNILMGVLPNFRRLIGFEVWDTFKKLQFFDLNIYKEEYGKFENGLPIFKKKYGYLILLIKSLFKSSCEYSFKDLQKIIEILREIKSIQEQFEAEKEIVSQLENYAKTYASNNLKETGILTQIENTTKLWNYVTILCTKLSFKNANEIKDSLKEILTLFDAGLGESFFNNVKAIDIYHIYVNDFILFQQRAGFIKTSGIVTKAVAEMEVKSDEIEKIEAVVERESDNLNIIKVELESFAFGNCFMFCVPMLLKYYEFLSSRLEMIFNLLWQRRQQNKRYVQTFVQYFVIEDGDFTNFLPTYLESDDFYKDIVLSIASFTNGSALNLKLCSEKTNFLFLTQDGIKKEYLAYCKDPSNNMGIICKGAKELLQRLLITTGEDIKKLLKELGFLVDIGGKTYFTSKDYFKNKFTTNSMPVYAKFIVNSVGMDLNKANICKNIVADNAVRMANRDSEFKCFNILKSVKQGFKVNIKQEEATDPVKKELPVFDGKIFEADAIVEATLESKAKIKFDWRDVVTDAQNAVTVFSSIINEINKIKMDSLPQINARAEPRSTDESSENVDENNGNADSGKIVGVGTKRGRNEVNDEELEAGNSVSERVKRLKRAQKLKINKRIV